MKIIHVLRSYDGDATSTSALSSSAQMLLLDVLRTDPATAMSPYTSSYTQRIFRAAVRAADNNCEDALADALTSVQHHHTHLDEDADDWGYKTYTYHITNSDEDASTTMTTTTTTTTTTTMMMMMTIRVSGNIFAASTGGAAWDASFYMCEWLRAHHEMLTPAEMVAELGCGSGALGCFVLREEWAEAAMHMKMVMLTDGDADAVDNASSNLRRNGIMCGSVSTEQREPESESNAPSSSSSSVDVRTRVLRWEENVPADCRGCFDLLLATDVVYAPEAIEPLISTAHAMLKPGARCVIANALRTPASLELLESSAAARGFDVILPADVPPAPACFMHHLTLDRASMRVHILTRT